MRLRTLTVPLLIFAFVGFAAHAETLRVITTTGTASVDAAPDLAMIRVGVTHQARVAGDALDQTSASMQQVLARLESLGVEPRDLQTTGLSLQPIWSRQNNGSEAPPRVTGYVARNGLTVRVRNLEELGLILDSVIQDGANTFDGLAFSLQDPEAIMAEARADAVALAMAKARQLAKAADVVLGPVLSISEGGSAPRPVMMETSAARMASDVPTASGEISLVARVTMEFQIME
ncbi:MAG: SIMPL domain-containing protein [Pseudomonadota bacterium]